MITKQQQQMAQWVLDQVGSVNPYNKQSLNSPLQYQIYNSGYLAAYLSSLMREDPYIQRRFSDHIKQTNQPK